MNNNDNDNNHQDTSHEYPQHTFLWRNKKNSFTFLAEKSDIKSCVSGEVLQYLIITE